jgi:hypothetical protein
MDGIITTLRHPGPFFYKEKKGPNVALNNVMNDFMSFIGVVERLHGCVRV